MMKVAPPLRTTAASEHASERLVGDGSSWPLLHGLLDEDAEGKRRLRGALGQALLKFTTV